MSTVTAIISAYYAAEFLPTRLQNLFAQKPKPEIVVVCQGGSVEDGIASQYDVVIIRTPDIPTIGAAWNMGLSVATGDYITTANSDDLFTIDGLKLLVNALDEHPQADLVFSAVNLQHGDTINPWYRLHTETGFVPDIMDTLVHRCVIGSMPLWRRNELRFDESLTVACDYDMWLKMASMGNQFYYLSDICGTYQKRADSLEWLNKALCTRESELVRRRYAHH